MSAPIREVSTPVRCASTLASAAILAAVISASTVYAEDTRKKWQFGGGISYWSTDDNIRSNASTAYAPVDPSQGSNLPSILFSDPRPDANELNEPTIQDSFKLDFNASFGVTRWFALEIGGAYFKGNVGNIEFYSEDRSQPVSLSRVFSDPAGGTDCINNTCLQMTAPTQLSTVRNAFLPVGKITEVPITLSGLVRFRPESPFDPYIGAGVGYIFTNLNTADSQIGTPITISTSTVAGSNRLLTMRTFDDVQNYTNGLVVANIRSGARGILTYPTAASSGGTPITALTATVNDGSEFHLMGGVDYYFTDHWSVYIDGRYVWAQSKVKIRIDGQQQISSGVFDYGCQDGGGTCRTLNGGVTDISNAIILNDTIDDVQDLILIQGGDIRLGGFSLGIGAKFTF